MYRHFIHILVEDDGASNKMKNLIGKLYKTIQREMKELIEKTIRILIIPSHKVGNINIIYI